jgi:hypothetical protein
MAEPVKITIPASVAAFVRPGTPLEERLRGAGGQPALLPREQVLLLFCLGKDHDAQVRERTAASWQALDQSLVCEALKEGTYHPALLHSLALTHGNRAAVREALLSLPALADLTRELLRAPQAAAQEMPERQETECLVDQPQEALQPSAEVAGSDDVDEAPQEEEQEGEEYLSKYSLAQSMGISEKIKMGLTGDKEWRKILVKDANKLVSSAVIKNPRITESEVLTIIKSGSPNDEVMRLICANKEWVKNYPIRKALIENPKTPLANALRYLGTVNEKDLAGYAKSRNISSVIATQAKRMLLNKKK